MSLRGPTKMEVAGLVMLAAGVAAYFLDDHAGRNWSHFAGIGAWTLTGVVLFVGKGSLDLLRGVAAIPGYARREWDRRTSTAVKAIDPDEKPVNDQ